LNEHTLSGPATCIQDARRKARVAFSKLRELYELQERKAPYLFGGETPLFGELKPREPFYGNMLVTAKPNWYEDPEYRIPGDNP
jgi:hypothetical protein